MKRRVQTHQKLTAEELVEAVREAGLDGIENVHRREPFLARLGYDNLAYIRARAVLKSSALRQRIRWDE